MNKLTATLLIAFIFCLPSLRAQHKDTLPNRNIGILISMSVLESPGFRLETPAFFYSSKRHGLSIAAASKFQNDGAARPGLTGGYFLFIEPAFRDISFYFNYNLSSFIEKTPLLTHIIGAGVQIDLFKRFFMHHSVGLGLQQKTSHLAFQNTSGQLKLSIGYYLREIPVVHIHDDWEKK
jgi:hypothetical protein